MPKLSIALLRTILLFFGSLLVLVLSVDLTPIGNEATPILSIFLKCRVVCIQCFKVSKGCTMRSPYCFVGRTSVAQCSSSLVNATTCQVNLYYDTAAVKCCRDASSWLHGPYVECASQQWYTGCFPTALRYEEANEYCSGLIAGAYAEKCVCVLCVCGCVGVYV